MRNVIELMGLALVGGTDPKIKNSHPNKRWSVGLEVRKVVWGGGVAQVV